jgi:hypothetical protein
MRFGLNHVGLVSAAGVKDCDMLQSMRVGERGYRSVVLSGCKPTGCDICMY